MPRSTRLKHVLAFGLLVAPIIAPALSACGFGGGDGEDPGDECKLAITELCSLKLQGKRTFGAESIETTRTGCTDVISLGNGLPDLCVIAAEEIEIPAGVTVTASGERPLVLFAAKNLRILGTLDVSSRRAPNDGELLGAGATTFTCPQFDGVPGNGANGAGGGAGASFHGLGGNGGDGDNGNNPLQIAGKRFTAIEAAQLGKLHGGCRGQDGGTSVGNAGGKGGASGGAVYLVAKGAVQVLMSGVVAANGAGGRGGTVRAGGGGGGSGGMIVIEAPQVIHLGMLAANGGGGGEGGYASGATMEVGAAGADGAPGTAQAAGGNNLAPTGDGGSGGARDLSIAGAGAPSTSGGGGGGGVGWIRILSPKIDGQKGMSSPPFN